MKKIVILLSHIPNPRTLKKIRVLEEEFKISLIYWDRGSRVKEDFTISPENKVIGLHIKAASGNPMKKLIPLGRYIIKAMGHLRKEKPDIIHAANMDMLLISVLYKRIFNRGVKLVYEVGDLPKYTFHKKANSIRGLVSSFLQFIEKKLSRDVSKLIVTSPYFWELYFSGFMDRDKYFFIPNTPYKRDFDKYRKKEGGNLTIGFIGSLRYREQLKMLIDVVEEIDRDINVFIAGSGPAYEEILDYSKDKDFVEFYGPYNYEEEIASLYGKIDLTYSLYDSDLENVKIALPNRLYESIVCQLPIIVARDTKLSEFVEKEGIGVTVSAHDGLELREELLALIDSRQRIDHMEENCRKIKENYFYENNLKELVDLYRDL